MTLRRSLLVAVVLCCPNLTFAASKEIQELQRDVAQLQDQMNQLTRAQTDAFAGLKVLVQQALDASNKANTNLAVLENNIRQTLQSQEKGVAGPVANLSAKMDSMTNDVGVLRDSVSDISSRLNKLQQQIVDLGNAVRTMQAPAAPPPGAGAPGPGAAAGAPPMPATELWANANRDRLGGKFPLALQEYSDYVKYYGETDDAPAAQYYIGSIRFAQGNFDQAVTDFDQVLERYSDSPRTPDALYMKGLALVKLGQRTKGAQEFRELVKRFPGTEQSTKACSQLKGLGFSCGAPRAAARPRSRSSKKR